MTATINASTSGGGGIIQTADSSGILALQTAGTTAVTIDGSQNVGVGTASPTEKLTVNGNIKLGTSGTVWEYGPSTTGRSFFSNSDSTAYVGVYGSSYGSSLDAVVQLTAGTTSTAILNATGSFSLAGATRTANGVGITFPATQSASTDANTLDDYEEGTWTPSITFGGGSTGVTYSGYRAGIYTKIGNQVTVTGIMYLTNKGSSTGAMLFTGLPFSSNSGNGGYAAAAVYYEDAPYSGQMMIRADPNSTTLSPCMISTAGTMSQMTNSNATNTFQVRFSFTYIV